VSPPLLALVGATASGKTEASLVLAERLGAEVICVDSMLVYRGMDVGTAKPTREQQSRVRHHLLDLADPSESFSVARFQSCAREAVGAILSGGSRPLLVGGGGLYYRAVVDQLEFPSAAHGIRGMLSAEAVVLGPHALHGRLASFDPQAAGRIDPSNVRRTIRALEVPAITGRTFSSFAKAWDRYPVGAVRAAGVRMERATLHRRIEERVLRMMPGLMEEARGLLERGFGGFITSSQAIGYAEAASCLRGEMSQDEAAFRTTRRTKALARRQMAWLKRDPRIGWFAAGEEGAPSIVEDVFAYFEESA
jgi:tRNA dimethylallyltransferase